MPTWKGWGPSGRGRRGRGDVPDPGLRHLHPRLALRDVEQDEHPPAGGDPALDDGAPRPVGDAQGGTGRQRAGVDDAVRLLAAVQEVDGRFVEPRWLAAEAARA